MLTGSHRMHNALGTIRLTHEEVHSRGRHSSAPDALGLCGALEAKYCVLLTCEKDQHCPKLFPSWCSATQVICSPRSARSWEPEVLQQALEHEHCCWVNIDWQGFEVRQATSPCWQSRAAKTNTASDTLCRAPRERGRQHAPAVGHLPAGAGGHGVQRARCRQGTGPHGGRELSRLSGQAGCRL